MPSLPTLRADELIRALERTEFQAVRQRGGHVRLKHDEGRVVPVHSGQDIGRGLLRKILRAAELPPEEFLKLL